MNEQLLKTSDDDVLSSRKKLKKPYVGQGGIHHPLVSPRVKIMCVMSLAGYDLMYFIQSDQFYETQLTEICQGRSQLFDLCGRPGLLSFPHILKIAHVTSTY